MCVYNVSQVTKNFRLGKTGDFETLHSLKKFATADLRVDFWQTFDSDSQKQFWCHFYRIRTLVLNCRPVLHYSMASKTWDGVLILSQVISTKNFFDILRNDHNFLSGYLFQSLDSALWKTRVWENSFIPPRKAISHHAYKLQKVFCHFWTVALWDG